jgi:hypothetical protein
MRSGFVWFRIGTSGGSHGASDSIKEDKLVTVSSLKRTLFHGLALLNVRPLGAEGRICATFFSFLVWGETESSSPLDVSATNWLLYQSRMIDDDDDDECGVVGGMRIGRGNQITRREPASVSLSPRQIPYELTGARTRAPVGGSRRLTT